MQLTGLRISEIHPLDLMCSCRQFDLSNSGSELQRSLSKRLITANFVIGQLRKLLPLIELGVGQHGRPRLHLVMTRLPSRKVLETLSSRLALGATLPEGSCWRSAHSRIPSKSRHLCQVLKSGEDVSQASDPPFTNDTHVCVAHSILSQHLDTVACLRASDLSIRMFQLRFD